MMEQWLRTNQISSKDNTDKIKSAIGEKVENYVALITNDVEY